MALSCSTAWGPSGWGRAGEWGAAHTVRLAQATQHLWHWLFFINSVKNIFSHTALVYYRCWCSTLTNKSRIFLLTRVSTTRSWGHMKWDNKIQTNITMESWKSPMILERNTLRASPLNQIIIITFHDKIKPPIYLLNTTEQHLINWYALRWK